MSTIYAAVVVLFVLVFGSFVYVMWVGSELHYREHHPREEPEYFSRTSSTVLEWHFGLGILFLIVAAFVLIAVLVHSGMVVVATG